ncbi:vigilin [Nephila pilipes]|uniref:Vigilin n=1 Tax=Nephila pilipes TaxID=299642 RepID=A0A8X6K1S9_NEPPI|nr:vigilin [Nephila pilipes]
MIDNFCKQVAYEEVKINTASLRHEIGKNSSNINILKEDIKILTKILSDNENDVARIEVAPDGVAEVKQLLLEMVHEMESEIFKYLIIEQCFYLIIIDAKGEKIREIRDQEKGVMKAKKHHLEISNEKQLVGHTAEIKANPEQYKF